MNVPRALLGALVASVFSGPLAAAPLPRPRNIVFILTDDHRYDALGFLGHPFLETPHLDSLARHGAHLKNTFVTTALCSPSRASILTGQYAHRHGVVDNNNPVRPDLVFFPQQLQQAGYKTSFFGKWHMGADTDTPQRGFDKWVSFRGQGDYWPDRRGTPAAKDGTARPGAKLNVDGRLVPQKGYLTDELTDYAVTWVQSLPKEQPFFVYLSHKAAHGLYIPADRHAGRYANQSLPASALRRRHVNAPMWVQNQRNSWHGVDFAYHSDLEIVTHYRSYCETLLAVDDSVGRMLALLRERGQLDDTLVVYMGDNGHAFGEQGLIDKRTAYEVSMRVPLLLQCPAAVKGGTIVPQIVANIDIAATLLEAAGAAPLPSTDGRSFWPLVRGQPAPWRTELLYEYFWERNFPQTPTLHALREDRYKYTHAYGLWDLDELYDLQRDPGETENLIFSAPHQAIVRRMNERLFAVLKETGGMYIPLQPDRGRPLNLRRDDGAPQAIFPPEFFREKPAQKRRPDRVRPQNAKRPACIPAHPALTAGKTWQRAGSLARDRSMVPKSGWARRWSSGRRRGGTTPTIFSNSSAPSRAAQKSAPTRLGFQATASNTTSGCRAATRKSTRAAPVGCRRPCSQFWRVPTLIPSMRANSDWLSLSLARTTATESGSIRSMRVTTLLSPRR